MVPPQLVDQVLEVLDMAALIGADGYALGILLQRRRHHLRNASVMAEMDDLGPLGLQQTADDVDRRVVAVKQAGGGDEPERRTIFGDRASRQLAGFVRHSDFSLILTRMIAP